MHIFKLYRGQWGLLPDGTFRQDPWYIVAGKQIVDSGFGRPPKGFPQSRLEAGVILPGLVNAHTHLELSFLAKKLKPGNGIFSMAFEINQMREKISLSEKIYFANKYLAEALKQGTFFFNDISNDIDFSLALLSSPYFRGYRFFEILGFSAPYDEARIEQAEKIIARDPTVYPTIHSPYGSSPRILRFVREKARRSTLSIHLLEAPEEYLLAYEKGLVYEFLKNIQQYTRYPELYQNSILEYLYNMGLLSFRKLFLVHLLHARKVDIDFISENVPHAAWVLCHRSNLFLGYERKNFAYLMESPMPLLIGTDSLATCEDLSVIRELQQLVELGIFKESQLLRAATFSAYEYFEIPLTSVPLFLFKGAKPEISSLANCPEVEILEG